MSTSQNVVTIPIPGILRTTNLYYNNEYIEFKRTRIRWRDLTEFYCECSETSWNSFPPTEIEVDWRLESSDDEEILIIFGGGMFSIEEKRKTFQQLVVCAQRYALPALIRRYLQEIAIASTPVNVADIGLSRKGIHYTRKRLFRSAEVFFVPWSDFVALTQDPNHFYISELPALEAVGRKSADVYDSCKPAFDVRKSDYNWMIIPEIFCRCAKELGKRPFVWIDGRKVSFE